jgi:hypothetical protein
MKKLIVTCVLLLAATGAQAENLQGVDEMVCSAGQVQICLETGDCYTAMPWELSIPEFVVIDLEEGTVSTTKASGLNRSTAFSRTERLDGLIYLQGIDRGRAFSFVIDEATGRLTVAVSRDGLSVSVFGACTDTDL